MKKKETKAETILIINEIKMGEIGFHIVGESPMIMNRFSQKAWQELLLPSAHKNRASLEQSLKHDPEKEFRGGLYLNRDPKRPSLIHIPNGAFHGALAAVAIDIPGAKKAQIERLTKVVDVNIDLYGVPELFMAMVRNSDINRTPDVRTRPIFPRWACGVTIRYMQPVLTERAVAHLLAAAGKIIGIGDWRGQKGGPYGAFRLADEKDAEFREIVKTMGRAAQQKAVDHPVCYDADSEELLAWFQAEVARREMEGHLAGNGKARKAKPKPNLRVVEEDRDGNIIAN